MPAQLRGRGQDSVISVNNGKGWVALVWMVLEALPRTLG